ncbi:MAG: hypothetical protein HQL25_01585 [Candidatus Omnitrophica bacterium]|nr:hypothetical protein [Candidatus Omnitrophota bacterium]
MSDLKNVLNSFVDSKSQFFDLPDGEEKSVRLLGAEKVQTTFQGTKVECVRYKLEVEGKELFWDRTSRELAKQMCVYSIGDYLLIKRTGKRNQTKYEIDKIL